MSVIGQRLLATLGPLLVSYPLFRSGEMKWLKYGEDDPAVWVWRWVALLLPVGAGLILGLWIQAAWTNAYVAGRFAAILPTLWFLKDSAPAVSALTLHGAIVDMLPEAGGLEMWIGAIFYSIGVHWGRKRATRAR